MSPRTKRGASDESGYQKTCSAARPGRTRVSAICELLDVHYSDETTALEYRDPFELLIATILSAQCTDEVVNRVTVRLFQRYPTPSALATASVEEVEDVVRPTGFYRNKARNITAAASMIDQELGGELPRSIDEMVKIPGVARKTANVVLGTAFGIAEGVAVDTHVMRVTRRWRFHDSKDPVRIERCLESILPKERWISFSHQTIWHGRRLCMSRNPRCVVCPFLRHCPDGEERVSTPKHRA